MAPNPYTTYHIDPQAFRENGTQDRIDEAIEVNPTPEDVESVLKRLRSPYTALRRPTKPELEKLVCEGLSTGYIADRCQVNAISVQNWLRLYKINFKKVAEAGREEQVVGLLL